MKSDAAKQVRFVPNSMPAELAERRQWVGVRIMANGKGKPRKIPVVATDPSRNASSTDPATWGTFKAAVAGLAAKHYDAVGYVFTDDVVGIDLDGERWVVNDGELSEEAETLIDRCGSYAEWSISGKGAHVLLHGQLPGSGHNNMDSGIEVYQRGRYFVMTGQHLLGTPAVIHENQAALEWILSRYFEKASERAERTEDMTSEVSEHSDISEHSECPVVCEPISVEQLIADTQPKKMGQRNTCIYRLARGLKFNSAERHANAAKWKPTVRAWHEKALPVIGTSNFDETWSDFLRAYKSALLPLGDSLDEWALQRAKESLPPAADGYETERIKLLVGMCWHLAMLNPQQRFFLSSHRAGALLGVSQSAAMGYLWMLCTDGVIEVVQRGNQRQATRYRYVAVSTADVPNAETNPSNKSTTATRPESEQS